MQPLVSQVLATSRATDPIDRFVLVAIASHIGKNDSAWPSYDALALETGYSTRTVKRAVLRLSGRGDNALSVPELLVDVHGGRIPGRPRQHQPNAYRIVLSGDSLDTPSGDSGTPLVVTAMQISGDRERESVVTPVAHELQQENFQREQAPSSTSVCDLERRRLQWMSDHPNDGAPLLSEFMVGRRLGPQVAP